MGDARPRHRHAHRLLIDRGPVRIETDDDVLAAAPEVVRKAWSLVREGADAVIIDCMSEPGLGEAQRSVPIPVIGPRSAVLAAVGGGPVTFVRDEAAAGLTGLAASLQATLGVRVLDPLPVALWEAIRRVRVG